MLNVGIIGAGRMCEVRARAILEGGRAHIKAISNTGTKRPWLDKASICPVYDDHRAILDDPDIDAVFICSSTDSHAELCIEAAAKGKHIFCEKPIDLELSRVAAVLEAVHFSDKVFQVGFNRRFDADTMRIRREVMDGQLGAVQFVRVTSRDAYAPKPEFVVRSGGMFLDMMIHDLDMIAFLSGEDITEVFAMGAVLVDPAIGAAGDIDTAVITAKLTNGALAYADGSRRAAYGYDQRFEVLGSKGRLANSNHRPSNVVFSGAEGLWGEKPMWFLLERYADAFRAETIAFIDAVENGAPVEMDAHEALKPMLCALAAKRSQAQGRPVAINELWESPELERIRTLWGR